VLAEDEERRSLERALHDGAQQDLVGLAVNIQLARELIARDPDGAAELLDALGRDVQHALEETARLAGRIYPPLLEAGGLGAAVRATALATGVRTEISVTAAKVPPAVAGAVYFCWLDALGAVSDARPATVTVVVDDDDLTFELAVGTQAVPDAVLARMRDRVEAISGRLTIDASADGRTAVHGRLPLAR
jgi:signal transduction histidine kinase